MGRKRSVGWQTWPERIVPGPEPDGSLHIAAVSAKVEGVF